MGVAAAARRPSFPATPPNGPVASASPLIRGGLPGAQGDRGDHAGMQPGPEADRYVLADPAVGPHDSGISVELPALPGALVNPGDERGLGADQAAEFVGDRAEHLGRAGTLGDQRGYPLERGLLLRQLVQPCLVREIMAICRIGGLALVGAAVRRTHRVTVAPGYGDEEQRNSRERFRCRGRWSGVQ